MDYRSLLSWAIGVILGLASIYGILCKVVTWSKKTRAARYAAKNTTILTGLEQLKHGQQAMESKLLEMDCKRDSDRDTDAVQHARLDRKLDIVTADLRVSVSAAVTALDGIIQLGVGLDKPVNGPVAKMREKLSDRITEGIGAEPMHRHGR